MTLEEKKAKKAEYLRNYYKNLSRFQKEKRRLKNLENKKKNYHDESPEKKGLARERNKRYYLKNIDKIKAYQKEYRLKKKESC